MEESLRDAVANESIDIGSFWQPQQETTLNAGGFQMTVKANSHTGVYLVVGPCYNVGITN